MMRLLGATFIVVACLLLFGAALTQAKTILVLVPSQAFLRLSDGTLVRVGSYLDEVFVPSYTFLLAGHQLVFASPEGTKPAVDPRSNQSSYFPNATWFALALTWWENFAPLQMPWRIADFASEAPDAPANATTLLHDFDALFIPGGHAPIIDLYTSTAAGRIIADFASHGKLVGAICHGPLVLASTSLLPGANTQPWTFSGKNMTVFSMAEEKLVEENVWDNHTLGFYPQNVLSALGGNLIEAPGFPSHVEVDGMLVTGQNPQSAVAFAAAFLEVLATSP